MRTTAAAAMVLAFAMAGCTGGPEPAGAPTAGATSSGSAATGPSSEPAAVDAPPGVVRVQGCEPRSLLPSGATTRCGGTVVNAVFRPLVHIDPVDGTPRWGDEAPEAVAATVSSIDARRWVVELKEDWEFHDGTPVTAASFVDAWNFAAYGPNAQPNAFLFEPIVGFDALHCPQPGCEPTAERLRGLRVIDELTFEIVLASPDRTLPRRLGHLAFSPLPDGAYEDPAAWGEAPVGNGPFRMEGGWLHGERISLRVHEGHAGTPPEAEGIDLLLYEDGERAWQDLVEGRLDVVDTLPPPRRAQAREALQHVARRGDHVQSLVVPSYLPGLDDHRLAVALSMAIDRRGLIDAHLDGAARPARGLVPAVVSDDTDRCAHRCRFDPAAAREWLDRVGIPEGGIELWFDRDSSQEPWVRAIARGWRQHLGLEQHQVRVRSLPHTMWVSHLQDQRIGGLYPIGWSMDVASPLEYLEELHGPSGLFNFDRYVGADVGVGLAQASAADSDREVGRALRGLEQDILEDMHHIPLWTLTHEAFHTARVTDVALDGKGRLLLSEVRAVDDGEQ